jgi:hypothetical protein
MSQSDSAVNGTNKNGLPPYWDVRQDRTGRIYYVNHQTKTTQWTDPRPLPEGWQVKFDERLKRHYYVNHVMKTTQWDDPRPPLVIKQDTAVGNGPKRETAPDNAKGSVSSNSNTEQKSYSTGNDEHDREWYKDVLKMSLLDKQISPDEEALLAAVRKKLKITDDQHEQLLKDVGWTAEEFKKVRKDTEAATKECVICLDAVANMVIMDCMHICLCEDCAKQYHADNTKTCPKCRSVIKEVRKTY